MTTRWYEPERPMFVAGSAEVGPGLDVYLFGLPLRLGGRNARGRKAAVDAQAAARIVEAHTDFRIQRRLQAHPAVGRRPLADVERMLVVLETKTTRLNAARDEVIELGMPAVGIDASGRVFEILDAYNAAQTCRGDPAPEVTRLTGITPEMLVDGSGSRKFKDEPEFLKSALWLGRLSMCPATFDSQ